ncbi:MAG: CRISPR-associated helicase Cas3' [Magnetococcales bacterium]|nr:CRISPR-associated helicase Cas3' [Magnetococcales bacterium]
MKTSQTNLCWGKRCDRGSDPSLHPLTHHGLEVAFVLRSLLDSAVVRRRLAAAVGLEGLSPRQVARLSVWAALHDAGKCNHGFQEQGGGWNSKGHVREIFKLLLDPKRTAKAFQAMGLDLMAGWSEEPNHPIHWAWAVFCHHGRPLRGDPFNEGAPTEDELKPIDIRVWEANARRDPMEGLRELAEVIRRTLPEAFVQEGGDSLPLTPPLQHLFNGLLTLADWIGSDEALFPFAEDSTPPPPEELTQKARRALERLGVDVARARAALGDQSVDFQRLFGFPVPNAMQREISALPPAVKGDVVILEAETGAGKTEAALLHFFHLFQAGLVDGLYFALPTRAAAVQIHGRISAAVKNALGDEAPPVVLAVPGYLRVDQEDGRRIAPFETLWPEDPQDRLRFRGWAAEHPKRYLAAPIAVGTVDQALLSALAVPHAHMRAAALSRLLLVVDEVHASDPYMTAILQEVIKRHLRVGGQALLMSATLGAEARVKFFLDSPRWEDTPSLDEALQTPYPLLSRRHGEPIPISADEAGKRVTVSHRPLADDPGAVADLALQAARRGARVLVIRNTVGWAMQTQSALELLAGEARDLLFQCAGAATPHHSRYAPEDRKRLDAAIEAGFGKKAARDGGLAAVSTQTTEQSLDIDADLLITDLCPMDVLLQRVGRLHRHHRDNRPEPYRQPRLLLLTPAEGLEAHLDAQGEASRSAKAHGWGSVYPNMVGLAATLDALPDGTAITIPADNRRLVEAATHPGALERLAKEKGPAWHSHFQQNWGKTAAQGMTARAGLYDRDKWMHECRFQDIRDERLTTRLGLEDRLVRFDPPPLGPFGERIALLTLPGRWLKPPPPLDAPPEAVEPEAGGFAFTFGNQRYCYDRLGLRPAE